MATIRQLQSYRYPLDVLSSTSDYMRFQIVKYQPPGVRLTAQSQQSLNSLLRTSGGLSSINLGNLRASSSEIALNNRPKEKTEVIIDLPMPMKVEDKNFVSWKDGNMNSMAQAIGSVAEALMGDENNFEGGLQGLVSNFGNVMGNVARGIQGNAGGLTNIAGNFLVNLAINSLGQNVSFNDYLARNNGIIINPNMELLFNGPGLRSFNFAFTLIARNKKEADEIKMIIRTLKQRMSAKRTIDAFGPDQIGGGFLQTPDVFKIRYMSGSTDHPFLNKFKFCALKDIGVNYAGNNQYMSYEDGTPVCVIIALAFQELSPVYNEDYNQIPVSQGVGF